MVTKSRQALINELIQSYQQVRQLFMHQLQAGAQSPAKQACMRVLKILANHGPMSQHAIAQELCHSDAAISRQIKLLLRDKAITSLPDPANRRRTIISLTSHGRSVLRSWEIQLHQQVANLLVGLSDSRVKQLIQANQHVKTLIIKRQSV